MVQLVPGTSYAYRLELTSASGRTLTFEPTASPKASKVARILQPPGGAGSFTTNTTADTQFPVITFGPLTSSNGNYILDKEDG